jgi:GTP:adenosylcobinamide-phosphate guanylyltransferase
LRTGTSEKIRVVILAGQRPGVDPVAAMFGETYKAAVKIHGKAMLNHVIEAIDASGRASDIHILLQEPDFLRGRPEFADLVRRSDVHLVASNASISGSLLEFVRMQGSDTPLLVTTCDHILLRGEDINAFIDKQPTGADLTVGLIKAETVLAAHPDVKRTWLKFSDGAFTSCNLFMLAGERAKGALNFWASVEEDRKKVWRMALRFGPITLLGVLLKRLSLEGSFKRASKTMKTTVRPVLLDHADLAIDVDKVSDVTLVQRLMEP